MENPKKKDTDNRNRYIHNLDKGNQENIGDKSTLTLKVEHEFRYCPTCLRSNENDLYQELWRKYQHVVQSKEHNMSFTTTLDFKQDDSRILCV